MRAFLPTPVPRETLERILEVAARAPSGTNTQPWQVHVLTGASRDRLVARLQSVYNDPEALASHSEEYAYYPREWVSPYIDRRRKVGWDLYGLLGITKGDKDRMHAQHGRNYSFFDAPVGLMFTIDRVMQQGSWLDYGMFLQSIMVAARARGLDTCPQAAFTQFHRIISDEPRRGRRTRCWSAACRWAMRTRRRWKTRWSLSGNRSADLCASSIDRAQAGSAGWGFASESTERPVTRGDSR
jgi:nitroreductase